MAQYRDFVRGGTGQPGIWETGLHNQIYLGGEAFVARMQRKIKTERDLSEIPRAQRRPVAKPIDYYSNRYPGAHTAMAKAYLSGNYSMAQIARHFGVHYATVSRAVRHMKLRESNVVVQDLTPLPRDPIASHTHRITLISVNGPYIGS